jgi:hypothetical protein
MALEKDVQAKILKYLRKTYPQAVVYKLTETTNCGIPDIIFIHNKKVAFIEAKRPGGRVSRIQECVIRKINSQGVIAEVVFSVENVKELLKEIC